MKSIRSRVLASIVSLGIVGSFALPALSAGTTGTLTNVTVVGSQYAYITFDFSAQFTGTRPSCHNGTSYPTSFAFDISTSKGRALLALAQAGLLANKSLLAGGAGNACTNVGTTSSPINIERLDRLTLWST